MTYANEPVLTLVILALLVAPIHAAFQLGISILTLLSGHTLGARRSQARLLRLSFAFTLGAFAAIYLLALAVLYLLQQLPASLERDILWAIVGITSLLIGFVITFGYYRRGKGTVLWLPRKLTEYLSRRAKKTKNEFEAATLGFVSMAAELPLAIAPLLVFGSVVALASSGVQLTSLLGYALIVCLPLVIVTVMIGAGHRLSTIQRWREANKTFLQYTSGIGLIAVALYITVLQTTGGGI